jgi:hypothetical protein
VTPGLTIRDRLRVLQPNYYENLELVPRDMLADVQRAKVVITNYHAFKLRERLEISKGGRALLKGRHGTDLDTLEEWQIPREAEDSWSKEAKSLHAKWWEQRIARQKEIDASIAAKADYEYLYDKPYDDKAKVRVAGPFTVESLSPHRVLGVDENDE